MAVRALGGMGGSVTFLRLNEVASLLPGIPFLALCIPEIP